MSNCWSGYLAAIFKGFNSFKISSKSLGMSFPKSTNFSNLAKL